MDKNHRLIEKELFNGDAKHNTINAFQAVYEAMIESGIPSDKALHLLAQVKGAMSNEYGD